MGSAIGPIGGYIGGAFALSKWVDFDQVPEDEVEIDGKHPSWVGAWWIGVCVVAGCCFLISIPFMGFPKQLPGVSEIKKNKVDESVDNDSSVSSDLKESAYPQFMSHKL